MPRIHEVALSLRCTIGRWSLFKSEDPLMVAVSGGIDSVVLLHLLLHLPRPLRPKIYVVHYNHKLRGRQSDGDQAFVETICGDWKVPFFAERAGPWSSRSNLQSRARELRYDFFRRMGQKVGSRLIATAHQADDQAETFLMRWVQGAGLKGLSGIPLKRRDGDFTLIRPLLFTSRAAINSYAAHCRLSHREDASNKKTDYLRNRIRKLLPSLRRENPRIGETTAFNMLFLQEDQRVLDEAAEGVFRELVCEEWNGVLECHTADYERLLPGLRYRLLQKMVGRLTPNESALPSHAILKMDELVSSEKPKAHYDLPQGLTFAKESAFFRLSRKRD